jgi:hypothetical protein
VIVQVFVAQRQPVDALRQHLGQLMLDQQRHAVVAKAARQTAQRVDPAIHFAQQQSPAPPSVDTWPAVDPASTRREKGGKAKSLGTSILEPA